MTHGFPNNASGLSYVTPMLKDTKSADFTSVVGTAYNCNHSAPATQIVCTMPVSAAEGDEVEFLCGANTGGIKVAVNPTHLKALKINSVATGATANGYILSGPNAAIRLRFNSNLDAWCASMVVGTWDGQNIVSNGASDFGSRVVFSTDDGDYSVGAKGGRISSTQPRMLPGATSGGLGQGTRLEARGTYQFQDAPVKANVKQALALSDMSPNSSTLSLTGSIVEDTTNVTPAILVRYGRAYKGFNSSPTSHLSTTSSTLAITGDLSVDIVFYHDGFISQATESILSCCTSSGLQLYFRLAIQAAGAIQYQHHESGTLRTLEGATTIESGWHTLTLQRNAATKTVVIKVDGAVHVNKTYDGTVAPSGSGLNLYLGQQQDNTTPFISGSISEVRVWNRAVPQPVLDSVVSAEDTTYLFTPEGTEVACWLMESPANTTKDFSGNARDLTITGTIPTKMSARALNRFDAGYGPFSASNHLAVANAAFALNGDFAASGAFTYNGTGGNQEIFELSPGTSGEAYRNLYLNEGRVATSKIVTQDGLGNTVLSIGPHTFTLRYVSTNLVIKVDGVTEISVTVAAPAPSGTNPTLTVGHELTTGGAPGSLPFIGGAVLELRIWGATSTPSQALLDQVVSTADDTYRRKTEGNEIACYFFGQTDELLDSVTGTNTFVATGTPSGFRVPGTASGRTRFDRGVDLDGTNDYYGGATHSSFGDASWFIGFDTDSTSAVRRVLYMVRNGGSTVMEVSQRASDGNLQIILGGQTLAMGALTTAGATTNRLWITRNATTGTIRARLNGGGIVNTTGTTGTLTATNQAIGADDTGSPGSYFDGGVYDLRYFPAVKTESTYLDPIASTSDSRYRGKLAGGEENGFFFGAVTYSASGNIARNDSDWQMRRAVGANDVQLVSKSIYGITEIDTISLGLQPLDKKIISATLALSGDVEGGYRKAQLTIAADGNVLITKADRRLTANAPAFTEFGNADNVTPTKPVSGYAKVS